MCTIYLLVLNPVCNQVRFQKASFFFFFFLPVGLLRPPILVWVTEKDRDCIIYQGPFNAWNKLVDAVVHMGMIPVCLNILAYKRTDKPFGFCIFSLPFLYIYFWLRSCALKAVHIPGWHSYKLQLFFFLSIKFSFSPTSCIWSNLFVHSFLSFSTIHHLFNV